MIWKETQIAYQTRTVCQIGSARPIHHGNLLQIPCGTRPETQLETRPKTELRTDLIAPPRPLPELPLLELEEKTLYLPRVAAGKGFESWNRLNLGWHILVISAQKFLSPTLESLFG